MVIFIIIAYFFLFFYITVFNLIFIILILRFSFIKDLDDKLI